MPTRVALILSLSHSGSTVLDLILGSSSRCVGLGEVYNALRMPAFRLEAKFGEACTCGTNANSCEFWGPVKRWSNANFDSPMAEKFAEMLRHFERVFGRDRILVDSSKKIAACDVYRAMPDVELVAIHLLKDVRSYAVSQLDRLPAEERTPLRSVRSFRRWHRKNVRIQRALDTAGIPRLQVGYEDLCRRPESAVARICEFLGVEFEADMLELAGHNSHLISGNRIRNAPDRRRSIVHDERWLQRNDWRLAALLCPRVMRYNARETYGGGAVGF